MGDNGKTNSTLTRSLSLRFDTLAAVDWHATKLRMDRSSFINNILEHVTGIAAHQYLFRTPVPYSHDKNPAWGELADEFKRMAERGGKRKKKSR